MSADQDPFASMMDAFPVNKAFTTKTLSKQHLTSGETTGVIIVAGQSNGANTGGLGGLYTPVNGSKLDHMSADDGGVYACADPLLGCTNAALGPGKGNMFFRAADRLVTAGWRQRIVLLPVAVGGTSVSQWEQQLYHRIIIANRRALAKGFTVDAICWQQGEADNSLGTTQAAYAASFASIRSKVAAEVTAPWIVAKCSYSSGTISSPVRLAQAASVDGTTVFAGPDTDTLGGTNRNPDNTHFSYAGMDAAALLWRDAIMTAIP